MLPHWMPVYLTQGMVVGAVVEREGSESKSLRKLSVLELIYGCHELLYYELLVLLQFYNTLDWAFAIISLRFTSFVKFIIHGDFYAD